MGWTVGMDASTDDSDWDALPTLSVSDALNQIAAEQTPSDVFRQKCHSIALRVIGVLEKWLPDTVGHAMFSGSHEKGTAIKNDSDFDVVIFFYEMEPPFTDLLIALEKVLKANSGLFHGFKWKFRSSIHICFDVEGIQFDIAPAVQYDKSLQWNRWCCFSPSSILTAPTNQHSLTLKKIAGLPDPEKCNYLYSSSLAMEAVGFVLRQSDFVRAVIRLAKYWVRHVDFNKIQLRGKSLLVETLAIHACYTLSPVEMYEKNTDKAFLKFLEIVSNIATIRLYLYFNYIREEIPDHVFAQTPLVLDPVNPFNNLLNPKNFPMDALIMFQEAARVTIKKVKTWEAGKFTDTQGLTLILQMREEH